ncbi:hypothetical protein Tsubulata_050488 [Turnera subulata]|uniref:Nucleoplasmin-like domain-containing protein n=1 Tax=Turnera subulata TaxID=218843 RepID=A0A9Q0JQP1_9ROSI|nr:hypothetical protein Tsubulata_050488 [Turnera subulata]
MAPACLFDLNKTCQEQTEEETFILPSNQRPPAFSLFEGEQFAAHLVILKAHEGEHDIMSLNGFISSDMVQGGKTSLKIALAGPDNEVLGGIVCGSLIPATPVQEYALVLCPIEYPLALMHSGLRREATDEQRA